MKTKHPLIWKNFAMMPSLRKAVDVECFDDLVHGTIVSVVALVESICTKQDSVGAMQQSAVLVCKLRFHSFIISFAFLEGKRSKMREQNEMQIKGFGLQS